MTNNEKRRARRFELALPVTLIQRNNLTPLEVRTRDISSSGIFLEFSETMRPGAKVEFVITLPSQITLTTPVRLRCLGRVVRVDRGEKRTGVAVTIERYEFARLEQEAPKAAPFQ